MAQEEKARLDGIESWIKEQSAGDAPKLLPVEQPFVRYLLDALSQPGQKVKTYAHEGKEYGAADALKLMIANRPKIAVFAELSNGDSTKPAAEGGAGDEASRVAATRLAKEYMKKHGVKDFSVAFRAVLDEKENRGLKDAVAGVRPEGAQKDREGAQEMRQMLPGRQA